MRRNLKPSPSLPRHDEACAQAGCDGDAACAEACTLNLLGVGQCGSVCLVSGNPSLRRRLMEMGFCRGTTVQVIRRSPFGDPIELRLRGYSLSLRAEQAQCVSIIPASADRSESQNAVS